MARHLRQWRAVEESRDERILAAIRAGFTPTEIHHLMGVSRAHVYRLIGRKQEACQTATQA